MKTTQFEITELTIAETEEISGGFIFLLLVAVLPNTLNAAILLTPIAGAFYKGWNDYPAK